MTGQGRMLARCAEFFDFPNTAHSSQAARSYVFGELLDAVVGAVTELRIFNLAVCGRGRLGMRFRQSVRLSGRLRQHLLSGFTVRPPFMEHG